MDELNIFIKNRMNKSFPWSHMLGIVDANYVDNYESNKHNYNSHDFGYKFNDYGFRCDNFNQESDISIVFLGCSITEGYGLPVETVWAHQLLSKIRQKTNKNIPYWNLAIAGCGIDTQARHLYLFNKILKPKFVFALFPRFERREYCFQGTDQKTWGGTYGNFAKVDHVFIDDQFKYYQTARSFMIIDSILKQNNTQMYCSKWKFFENTEEELFIQENFPNFNFFPNDNIPLDDARDGKHPGPLYQTATANLFWDKINHLF